MGGMLALPRSRLGEAARRKRGSDIERTNGVMLDWHRSAQILNE
ncbi:hypothetical protein [Mycobacterium sp. SMC-8]|nr:hypothetical protein [Mycobacterium sp. SMC-8]